jgi:hypothetical protein
MAPEDFARSSLGWKFGAWDKRSPGFCILLESSLSCRISTATAGSLYIDWVPEGSLAGNYRAGFRLIFGQTWPRNPSRTTGLVLQCRLHQKSARQTNSGAIAWRQQIPARLPSGTQIEPPQGIPPQFSHIDFDIPLSRESSEKAFIESCEGVTTQSPERAFSEHFRKPQESIL